MANDPYGLIASGLPPELAAQLAGVNQQQAVAQALLQQGMSPLQAPEVKGRFQGRVSPLEGISKVIQAYMGAKGLRDVNTGYADIATKRAQGAADALNAYQRTRDGTPGQAPLTPNDDEGNPMPGIPAAPGNARAAVTQALLNPLIASNPIVAGDLKSIEKQSEPYSLRPNQQRFVADKVVATGQPEVATVTAAGPDGQPVTQFVPKVAGAPAIPQPVKQEMVNAGGSVVPVNPYKPAIVDKTVSPDAALSASTARRGQDMTDARQRELNGIVEGQSIGDASPGLVDSIGNYDVKLPPPPVNARNPMLIARYDKLVSDVKAKYPDWNAPNYEAANKGLKEFTSGKNGNQVRFVSTALDHIQTYRDALDALQNGNSPQFNALANKIATFTGQAAPTTADAIRQIVGDEVVKGVIGTGGGVADREAAAKSVSSAGSPAQLSGVLGGWEKLLGGQIGGLKRQYEQTTFRKDFDRFLSPAAQRLSASAEQTSAARENRRSSDQPGATVLKFDSQGNMIQ